MANNAMRFSTGCVTSDYSYAIKEMSQLAIPSEFINRDWDADSVIDLHMNLHDPVENNELSLPELQEIEHVLFTTPFSKRLIQPFNKHEVSYRVLRPGASLKKYIRDTIKKSPEFQFDTRILSENGSKQSFKHAGRRLDLFWISTQYIDNKTYTAIIIPQKRSLVKKLLKGVV